MLTGITLLISEGVLVTPLVGPHKYKSHAEAMDGKSMAGAKKLAIIYLEIRIAPDNPESHHTGMETFLIANLF